MHVDLKTHCSRGCFGTTSASLMTCHNVYSQMPECTKRNNTLPPRMFWYCMNCSACPRSSSDCDAKNLAKPSSPTCRQQNAYSAYVSLSAAACETCLGRADAHARAFRAHMHPLIRQPTRLLDPQQHVQVTEDSYRPGRTVSRSK